MKLVLAVVLSMTLATLALPPSPANATAGPGCLPKPLPSGPWSNPSLTMDVQDVADRMSVRLWRQPCQDSGDSVLLLRVTPTSTAPVLCGNRWYVDQKTTRFHAEFRTAITGADGSGPAFCDRVSAPTTVLVASTEIAGGEPATFDDDANFTLLFFGSAWQGGPYVVFSLDVPKAGSLGPAITVVATRCNPCRSGQTVGFDGQVQNPGSALSAEFKAGARMPDGSIIPLASRIVTLPSGASTLTVLPAQVLPAGLPTIDVMVEAALLEPALGITLSRHNLILHLGP